MVSGGPELGELREEPTVVSDASLRIRSRTPAYGVQKPSYIDPESALLREEITLDGVIETLLDCASRVMNHVVVFLVRDHVAIGQVIRDEQSTERVQRVEIGLQHSGSLTETLECRVPRVCNLAYADEALAKGLGRELAQPCLLLPVSVDSEVVLLLYGDRNGDIFGLADVAGVVDLLEPASLALERLADFQETADTGLSDSVTEFELPPDSLAPKTYAESALAPRASNTPVASGFGDVSVSVESFVHELARRPRQHSEQAIQVVTSLGSKALPFLVDQFPGNLWFDRDQEHQVLPRGRDVSAVAGALVGFGDEASDALHKLLERVDSDSRFYALLVISDGYFPILVESVARCILDTDLGVATLSVDILRKYTGEASFLRVFDILRRAARNDSFEPVQRAMALFSLGVLGDSSAIDVLVELLSSEDRCIRLASRKALSMLTNEDHASVAEWRLRLAL